jgi:formylglycine-generating enzyme required for sulfatase activity
MELVLIRPGVFWMGSPASEPGRYLDEGPRHRVRITRPFYLGRCQVTQEQYERHMGQNPSNFRGGGAGAERVAGLDTRRFPVESVSWLEATAFCAALSVLPAERAAGRIYRLPTEAEWEYGCRAGTAHSAPFHFGYSLSSRQANFDGDRPYGRARRGPNLRRPCPVGSYRPNAWGLHDMHGNVWEWCSDWFDETYYEHSPEDDPPGPEEGESRVLRGGSYYYIGASCRAAIRFGRRPISRSSLDGFRVALTHLTSATPAPS